jgi:PAS domain S-box-containing protein
MDDARGEGTGWLALEAFDSVPIAIALTIGQDHRLAYTNLAYRAAFGDRSLGEPISEVFRDLLQRDHLDLFDRVLATGEPLTLTEAPVALSFSDTGDEERFFSISLSRVAQEPSGVLITLVDVTGQVAAARRAARTAEQQRRILRRYQSLVQVTAQIVWVTDPAGEPIEPSWGWERVTGQSWEEFRGTGWTRALHPDDREPTIQAFDQARRQHRPRRFVCRLRTKDGEYRHFEINSTPVYENGVVVEWVGTYTDIEEQWQWRRRQELLDRAANATAEHTGLAETFGAIANVLVPRLSTGAACTCCPDSATAPRVHPSSPIASPPPRVRDCRRIRRSARTSSPPTAGSPARWSGAVRCIARSRRASRRRTCCPTGRRPG